MFSDVDCEASDGPNTQAASVIPRPSTPVREERRWWWLVASGRNDRVDYRKWTIRLGTSLGTVLLVAAMYAAMITRSWCNGSEVCDAPAPDHIHSRLAVMLGLAGVAILAGTIVTAVVWKPLWLRQREQ